ncbi:MAG: tRNA (adenine-N1)-methyltransferase [Thermoplasmata archaeon]|nr:MAG: tRNA (adenine-N1)-methyltransferase [Thermoplasmata archaeon]
MIQIGDMVTLIGPRGKFVVKVSSEMQNIKNLGVVDTGKITEKDYGESINIIDQDYIILKPSLSDKLDALQRKAQIILPKDALQLVGMCNIQSGSLVIEGGAGSGALTVALAHFVAPNGRVVTYETREDFAAVTRKNLAMAGAEKFVELKIADVTKGFDEYDADAVILDIPNPWNVVTHAWKALAPGGFFAVYVPTMNQVEKIVSELRDNRFIEPKSMETLQREIVVGNGGVRPSFDMLGHTGYITVARKIL